MFHLFNHYIVFMEAHSCVYRVTGKSPKNLRKTKKTKTVRVCGSERLDECVHSYALYYTANTVLVLKIPALFLKVPSKVDCKIVHILVK